MLQNATFDFLSQLNVNNNRVWFDENRESYELAKNDFEQFITEVLEANITLIPELDGRKAKECIFRIFKDVRFSKDKIPYKNNFGAGFGKGDKKMNIAGYYVHLQPGNQNFVGGGIWMPDAESLKAIRQEIDYHFDEFKSIIHKATFEKMFGNLEQSERLVRAPKGYEEINPAIDFLKLKSFTVGRQFNDKEMMDKNAIARIVSTVKEMKPFIDFLNRAIS